MPSAIMAIVFASLALAACSPKGGQDAAKQATTAAAAEVSRQAEERKCTDDPQPGEEEKLPRCGGMTAVAPPAPRAYRIVGGSGDPVDDVVCDIDDAFVLDGKLFGVEFSGGVDGTWKFVRTPHIPGLSWKAGGRYHIEFPDGAGKPGTMATEGGGTTTAGAISRDTTGGEHFTLTPVEDCGDSP